MAAGGVFCGRSCLNPAPEAFFGRRAYTGSFRPALMPLAKWTHDMIRTGLLALVFFALLRIAAKRFGSEVPGLQAAVNGSVGS